MSLASVLQKGKSFLTPRGSTDSLSRPFIFPSVDKAVDGEDCDHDCETCEVQLPKGWKIDTDESLYGHVNSWATHMLVATGKTDVRYLQSLNSRVWKYVLHLKSLFEFIDTSFFRASFGTLKKD